MKSDHTLWTVGSNFWGQLGDGSPDVLRTLPVKVASDVVNVAMGSVFTAFLKSDGSLWAVGDNSYGQLGDGTSTLRTLPVHLSESVAAIAAGQQHLVFIKTDGSLWTVGDNAAGQLGDGTTVRRYTPVMIADNVTAVAAGATYTLFVKRDHTLWATGSDAFVGKNTTTPHQITTGVAGVVGGSGHALLLMSDGSLWGIGANDHGNLGDGTLAYRLAPSKITTGVAMCAAGQTHSAFIKTDGSLWTMGGNDYGQLGDGTASDKSTPQHIADQVKTVAAGRFTTLFAMTNGQLRTVGNNYVGQLGNGTTSYVLNPTLLTSEATKVATCATSQHTMYITSDNGLWAVGNNTYGQLGDGTVQRRSTPVKVATDVVDVAVGENHSLWVKRDGTLWAVGHNTFGQLGNGSTTDSLTPVLVAKNAVAVAAGVQHSVYVDNHRFVYVMGYDANLDWTMYSTTPVRQTVGAIASIAAGSYHTVALDYYGIAWTFGDNRADQLGMNVGQPFGQPTPVMRDVRSIAAGGLRTFLVKTDGTLWGCGETGLGVLADTGDPVIATPVQIATDVLTASGGYQYALYLKTDGSLWGTGASGDAGYVDELPDPLPYHAQVQLGSGISDIAAGQWVSYCITPAGKGTLPEIATQPASSEFSLGDAITLRVNVTGNGPLAYRWRKDGIDLPGQRSDTLLIPYGLQDNEGGYDVVVTNSAGSVTSQKAMLSLKVATITQRPPAAISVVPGQTVSLQVTASASTALTYQWKKDGALLAGATGNVLTLTNAQQSDMGDYTVVLTTADGSMTIGPTTVSLAVAYISNLSVRTNAGVDAQALMVGFALGGSDTSGTASVLVRGVGPSLAKFDVTGFLKNPGIILRNSGIIATNDDWNGAPALVDAFSRVGAFPLLDATSADAALLTEQSGGTYSVEVTGGTGEVLVELYHIPPSTARTAPRLINVSTRALVGGANGSLMAGFVVAGTGTQKLLIRAIGPSLSKFSVDGLLADPYLEVFKGGETTPIRANDNWSGDPSIKAVFEKVGAFGLDADSKDAVMVLDLEPGIYSANVTGKAGSTGLCLIEVYEVR